MAATGRTKVRTTRTPASRSRPAAHIRIRLMSASPSRLRVRAIDTSDRSPHPIIASDFTGLFPPEEALGEESEHQRVCHEDQQRLCGRELANRSEERRVGKE